jgi:polar amino acid transport system substrate-binding protein
LVAWLLVLGGLLAFLAASTPVNAAEASKPLRVATRIVPPLVISRGETLDGFSIELWDGIAKRIGASTTYTVEPDVTALLGAVREGRADLGIAAISITAERDRDFDFSQPILSAGLQILVRETDGSSTQNPVRELLGLLLSPAILVWLGVAALLIIVPAHIVWFFERRHPASPLASDAYFPGIFHALFWAAGALATQADLMPRHWVARLVAVIWMFVGVVFVAFYTAQLTASMTLQQLQGMIRGPDDLPGRSIATTKGSTAAAWLAQHGMKAVEVQKIEDAWSALDNKDVDAIVFDAPVLLYYAQHGGKGKVALVGTPFRKEDYGIILPRDSELRHDINRALLAMREDGSYQTIYDRWFGSR